MILIILLLFALLFLLFLLFLPVFLFLRLWYFPRIRRNRVKTVAFFHPWSNDGGGGERVLWRAIMAVQEHYKKIDTTVKYIVYTGDVDVAGVDIIKKAKDTFDFDVLNVEFVFLKQRKWVEASRYPHFTIIFQCLGSLILGFEAMLSHCPDVVIDTMGYAFIYPIFRFIGGCRVGCYVHYPLISTDMLARVSRREESYNNAGMVAKSAVGTWVKVMYYRLVALLYGIVGRCSEIVMVNSSWTRGHISRIWGESSLPHIVYPPCDTERLTTIDIDRPRKQLIMSLSQFRPEKNQKLQLEAFSLLSEEVRTNSKLVLIGHVRENREDDRKILESLKERASQLGISDNVEFAVSVSADVLKNYLENASIGLHTMELEHFGIGIVDMMAAGLIVIAHNSGGPKEDIIRGPDAIDEDDSENDGDDEIRRGYLAKSAEEYAACISEILSSGDKGQRALRLRAREAVRDQFSEKAFDLAVVDCLEDIL